ncbi:MAG: KamA family radical SAM protein [Candidatus Omnitrophica bacterium]|nr:KamA family radical SAM protein [Candidatus Omnitrophota bacterium]
MSENGQFLLKRDVSSTWDLEERRRQLFPKVADAEWNDWHWQLRHAATSLESVMAYGKVAPSERAVLSRVIEKYPPIIVPYYLCLIDFDDPKDPIRIQSLPVREEIELTHFGEPDPLQEEEDMVVPGLIHRYPDRVLMQVTNLCPMNCRHCTRKREWEEGAWTRDDREMDRMMEYLAKTRQVRDVLISGGDPLVLATVKLERVLAKLRSISHIEIIRIGTRFPVVLPQRIDPELVEMLSRYRPLWVNTHFNHPREITREAAQACERLQRGGMPMNNQSVLLKNVNDSLPIMRSLCHGLLQIGVRPYYLYQCDPVQGTEHLRTSIWKGIEIIEGLRGHTTGFAVPQYVIDAPGGGGKIPMGPNYFLGETRDGILLRNYEGFVFEYQHPVREEKTDEAHIKKHSFYSNERFNRRKKYHASFLRPRSEKHYHGQRDWVLVNGKFRRSNGPEKRV